MSAKDLPSPELLRQLLRYEPETGELYWRTRTPCMFKRETDCKAWNVKYAGREALRSIGSHGYRNGSIKNKSILAHVAAYAIYYGEYPNNVDHINGIRTDNRIKNLRSVTKRENSLNRAMSSKNTSGHTGVVWIKHIKKWQAKIKIHGKQISLGFFSEINDAVKARRNAEAEYGFHKNHGKR